MRLTCAGLCREILTDCDTTVAEFHAYCAKKGLVLEEAQVLGTLKNLVSRKQASKGEGKNTFRKPVDAIVVEKKRTKKQVVLDTGSIIARIEELLGAPSPQGADQLYGVTLDFTQDGDAIVNKAMVVCESVYLNWSWKAYRGFVIVSFWR